MEWLDHDEAAERALVPCCPHCKRGGDEGEFAVYEVVVAASKLESVYATIDQQVEWESGDLIDLDWSCAMPANIIPFNYPKYKCLRCGNTFDEFLLLKPEEIPWRRMMEG